MRPDVRSANFPIPWNYVASTSLGIITTYKAVHLDGIAAIALVDGLLTWPDWPAPVQPERSGIEVRPFFRR